MRWRVCWPIWRPQRRRLEAVDQRVLAEVAQRGVAGEFGRSGPADLLVSTLRVAPGEARARLGRARDLGPRRALTGQLLLARLDPDGLQPQEEQHERTRGFTLRKHPDGSADPTGHLTPEVTALWETILDTLAVAAPAIDGIADARWLASPALLRLSGAILP